MNAATEEKVGPVEPGRLHQALGVYQSALVAKAPEAGAGESESVAESAILRAMQATSGTGLSMSSTSSGTIFCLCFVGIIVYCQDFASHRSGPVGA